ncbi:macro domain-containing protein [Flavobacterium sp. Fl-77]|uniref:Macro domain-containing protein n=1 Tax=Flavobacterium flavipigmentatum TaxID=2893884 RepID=A0AAJ2SD77_9FLAO|nr:MULTISPECIES: macro domain-containing protein [unclassified Flavobacterium]MDX6180766.1 macro domain-containing protein [Flavobacterium sp. Fl-33]MDX6184366.1 macro domain-containing protein [Flavobacterium sp. Fl-77]UFH39475.1 macro domain-containing protein [Flavobacterium sp. F-70]
MKDIKYTKGDATSPQSDDNKIIVHICNDIGGWGKGFVMAISKRWKKPEEQYREWFKSKDGFELGKVQFVQVEEDLWVANLIGQHKINKDENGNAPIRYDAIEDGLKEVASFAKENKASVHMPRIGCGLAGGKWEEIEPIILKILSDNDSEVTVYDF